MAINARSLWKLVGLAGLVGVTATGAVAVRAERKRRAYSPDEVRSRLHERFTQATAAADEPFVELTAVKPTLRQRLSRLRRRAPRA